MNTYNLKTTYIPEFISVLDDALKKRGNWKKSNKKNVDFLYVNGEYEWTSNRYKKLQDKLPNSSLKNFLDIKSKEEISLKNNLYKNMKKQFPKIYKKYFPKQFDIDLNNITNLNKIKKSFNKKKHWILKPVFSHSGKGIKVFDNFNDFEKYIIDLKKKNDCNKSGWNKKCFYVLSEYIDKIRLYKKKKFHIRLYFLVTLINNEKKCYYSKNGYLLHAKKEYNLENLSHNIHNTHTNSTNGAIFFPECLKNTKKLYPQFNELFKHIGEIIKPKCHIMKDRKKQNKNCFEVFIADIMITDKNKIKCLELNAKVGYSPRFGKDFYITFFNSLLHRTVDVLYPPENKLNDKIDYNNFIEVNNTKKYKLRNTMINMLNKIHINNINKYLDNKTNNIYIELKSNMQIYTLLNKINNLSNREKSHYKNKLYIIFSNYISEERFNDYIKKIIKNKINDNDISKYIIKNNYIKKNIYNIKKSAYNISKLLLKYIKINTTFKILDFGCDTGDIIYYLGKELKINNKYIYGCDIIKRDINKNINFTLIEPNNILPYKDNTFNCIIVKLVMHHIKKIDLILSEFSRILKKNGILYIEEFYCSNEYEYLIADIQHHPAIYNRKDNKNDYWSKYYDKYKLRNLLNNNNFNFIEENIKLVDLKEKIRSINIYYSIYINNK